MGPLAGVKIVELAGIGPGPMAAMLLAEMGASVVRIDRKQPAGIGIPKPPRHDLVMRGRPAIRVDLKDPKGVELVLKLVERSDGLLEGFRPGVTERMGLGPEACLARNPKLVYGRITGWGQEGPLARAAGHDPNYIALTGAVHGLGRKGQPPTLPFNVLGDFAGGSLYLVMGMLAAIINARATGKGQVVDAAIVDGTASLLTGLYGLFDAGVQNSVRGDNLTDTGAPIYECYACADGRWLVVAPIEEKFFIQMMEKLELDAGRYAPHLDRSNWPKLRAALTERFKTRTRDEWMQVFEGSDACVAPVLDWSEAPRHPHLAARRTFVEIDGIVQPAPAPRFSRTPSALPTPPQLPGGVAAREALRPWLGESELDALRASGTLE
jgi:crotonobetainyl-CoA:carnitine CoA-transferase CaiB-like acyl-CoA transferase